MSTPQPTPVSDGARSLAGRYDLLEPLGAGRTGQVWRAKDRRTGSQVAVKLASSPAQRQDLLAEAQVLRRLDSLHVVQLLDVLHVGTPALVLALAGGDLQQALDRRGPLPVRQAVRTAHGVLSGLEHAHARGVVHGDVKAANVLLAPGPLLCDFGSASGLGSAGTPEHLAPELVGGAQPSQSGDVYAAGCLLYALLAGRTPFAGGCDSRLVLQRQLRATPPELPGVPAPLWGVLSALLDKDPSRRPSAGQAARDLSALRRLRPRRALAAQPAPKAWDPPGWVPVVDDPARTAVRGLDLVAGR